MKPGRLYCLAAGGIAALQERGIGSTQAVRNLRKDAQASDKFAHHCLGIFAIHNALQARYHDRLQFLTRSFLFGNKTFPDPLPDRTITISKDSSSHNKQFLLGYIDNTKPQKKWQQRVLQLIDYIEGGESERPIPTQHCCSSARRHELEKRVNQWIRKADADNVHEFAQMSVATIQSVADVVVKAEQTEDPEARDSSRALTWEEY